AHRLGGNSLADTQVFGKIAGENAAKFAKEQPFHKVDYSFYDRVETQILSLFKRTDGPSPAALHEKLRNTMWDYVGIFRTEQGLKKALRELETIKKELSQMSLASSDTYYNTEWIRAMELINMVLMSEMIARSALIREESRGAHTRLDFPQTDNKNWLVILNTWKRNGEMYIEKSSLANVEIVPNI
ncbi:MAG: fumarate reductase/succinate dehydrogenase flavoprotein subunit, partial [Candidatus Hodarchaeota archaeon]